MVDATERELQAVGVTETPGAIVADPGYWHTGQISEPQQRGTQMLIPPESRLRTGTRQGWDKEPYATMGERLATDEGKELYQKRQGIVEPGYGQIKFNRKIRRFLRRGHTAVRSEWRLTAAT